MTMRAAFRQQLNKVHESAPVTKGVVGSIDTGDSLMSSYKRMMGITEEDIFDDSEFVDDPLSMYRVQSAGKEEIMSEMYGSVASTKRPKDIKWQVLRTNNWIYMYGRMYQYREKVSALSTITSRLVTELLRYNFIFRPKFAYKCSVCGRETMGYVDRCPNPRCHAPKEKLMEPDRTQLNYFRLPGHTESVLDCANEWGMPLKDVVKMYASDQALLDQAYMVCCTIDWYDKRTGRRDPKRRVPREFLVLDPLKVKAELNDRGEIGKTKAFCIDDRSTAYEVDNDEDRTKLQFMSMKDKIMYPAAWCVGSNIGATGDIMYYTKDEIYQNQWFRPSGVYGVPTWYDIEDDLQDWHYIEKHFLKRFKYGFVRKILVMPGFSDASVKNMCKGITDCLARNDNSIPIVCPPPQMNATAQLTAQALDLGTEDINAILAVKSELLNRLCAHVGIPNLFVGDTENSGSMTNDSQQITSFDRFIVDKMEYIDMLLKWVLSWYPEIKDWELVLDRPTKAMTDAKKRIDKIDTMLKMKQGGYRSEMAEDDFEFHYSRTPIDQDQQELQYKQMLMQMNQQVQQMAAQQQQMMQMMGGGIPPAQGGTAQGDGTGILPGDGEGPPEKGTARREDHDIDDTKNEIEQAEREAKE